jgi:hypothetical protein
MVIGIFFVNDTFAVVLFDSGALHSFISTTYVEKHNLPKEEICPQGSYARR